MSKSSPDDKPSYLFLNKIEFLGGNDIDETRFFHEFCLALTRVNAGIGLPGCQGNHPFGIRLLTFVCWIICWSFPGWLWWCCCFYCGMALLFWVLCVWMTNLLKVHKLYTNLLGHTKSTQSILLLWYLVALERAVCFFEEATLHWVNASWASSDGWCWCGVWRLSPLTLTLKSFWALTCSPVSMIRYSASSACFLMSSIYSLRRLTWFACSVTSNCDKWLATICVYLDKQWSEPFIA